MQASTYRSLALIVAASLAILCGYEVAAENFLTDKSMIRNLAQKHWWKQKQHWKRTHEMFEAHLAAENALQPSKQLSKSERIAKFAQFKAMKRDKTRVSSLQEASPSPEPTVSSLQAASPSPEPTVSSLQASPPPPPPSPSPPPPSSLQASPSPEPSTLLCAETCIGNPQWASDGICDDGGPGSAYTDCQYGTDCSDCGPRNNQSTVSSLKASKSWEAIDSFDMFENTGSTRKVTSGAGLSPA